MTDDEEFEKLSQQRQKGRSETKNAFDVNFFEDERMSDEEIEVEIPEDETHMIRGPEIQKGFVDSAGKPITLHDLLKSEIRLYKNQLQFEEVAEAVEDEQKIDILYYEDQLPTREDDEVPFIKQLVALVQNFDPNDEYHSEDE
eukprot:gene1013-9919_t